MVDPASRNFTGGGRAGERVGPAVHRGFGPRSRGETPAARGPGAIALPRTFRHRGTNTCNGRRPGPFRGRRLDAPGDLAHDAIVEV